MLPLSIAAAVFLIVGEINIDANLGMILGAIMMIQGGSFFAICILTEIALRKNFDKDGNRRN
jgi:hypothetical protein